MRTAASYGSFLDSIYPQTGYVYRPTTSPDADKAAWVTTGNDLTKFLTDHGVTSSNVINLIERGSGLPLDTHDVIIEYTVKPDNDHLMRPTKNPDITSYNPSEYGNADSYIFIRPDTPPPSGMDPTLYGYFQGFYANHLAGSYPSAYPWTQLGYTYFWGNGPSSPTGVSQIEGMSEFVILPKTTINVYAVYTAQSYIYTMNKSGAFSSAADAQYGNGFASFKVNGSCDSVWAGHRFQALVSRDTSSPNEIDVTGPSGAISGGQGILVWSLNYAVNVASGCTVISDGNTVKFGILGTADIGILFEGDTSTTYGTPVTSGINKVTNSGTIAGDSSNAGTAIKVLNGDTTIINNAGGLIAGTTAINCSASTGSFSLTNRGTITGGITLKDNTIPTTLDIGNSALAITNGSLSSMTFTANSAADFGSITTTGTKVNASSAVNVTIGGYIPNSAAFQAITGDAGVTAVPGTITSSSPVFTFAGSLASSKVNITATRANTYNSFAASSNAAAAGSILNAMAANNTATGDMRTILGALDSLTSGALINQALNSLTPNTDNSVPQTGYQTQTQFINTILSHFDNVPTVQTALETGVAVLGNDLRKAGIWAQGFDTYLHQDPRGLSNGYDANVWGASLGYDVPVIDNFICGLNGGYAWNNIRTKDSSARTTADNYEGSLYGSYSHNAYYIDAILSFAYNQYHSTRHVAFGTIDRTPKSDYGGQQYSAYLESGYTFKNNKVTLTPLVSAQYAHLHVNGYTENDAGAADLAVNSQDYDMFQTGLGARLAYKIARKDYTFIPDIHVKWLYDFIGDNQQSSSTFTGGGASFPASGFTPAQSSYDFGARWVFLSKRNITLTLNYDFELKEDFYSHSGYANVRYDF